MHRHHPGSSFFDVIIVGAGPVGLFLACELRLADVSVLVLERAENPYSPLKQLPFGMRGLSVATLEALYRRGLLDALAPPGHGSAQRPRHQAGHFAGIAFDYDKVDASKWRHRLPSPADGNLAVEMGQLENVLAAHASALGADIRYGTPANALTATADDVTVRCGDNVFQAQWLVGCDGGRSIVRKQGGFSFIGTEPEFTGYSVQVDIANPDALRMGRVYTPAGMYFQSQPGTIAMVEFDAGAFHRSAQVTLDHVQAVLRRVSGTDVALTSLRSATTWTDRAQQATAYRRGRLLLAGDAAHIHSPLGGQGLNLGLGDAMNLGWKLGLTINGHAPDALLDTYQNERHPIGEQVLDWSRAQVAVMRPARSSRALEAILRDLIDTRDGATYFAERTWGISLKYPLGGIHPLVGRSVPDFELDGGVKVGELLRRGHGLLLDFDNHVALRALASRWSNRLEHVGCDVRDRLGLSALLVRPDGFVAWACGGAVDARDLADAIAAWFGKPDL